MQIDTVKIAGVLTPARHGDARSFFSESWNHKTLREAGEPAEFKSPFTYEEYA